MQRLPAMILTISIMGVALSCAALGIALFGRVLPGFPVMCAIVALVMVCFLVRSGRTDFLLSPLLLVGLLILVFYLLVPKGAYWLYEHGWLALRPEPIADRLRGAFGGSAETSLAAFAVAAISMAGLIAGTRGGSMMPCLVVSPRRRLAFAGLTALYGSLLLGLEFSGQTLSAIHFSTQWEWLFHVLVLPLSVAAMVLALSVRRFRDLGETALAAIAGFPALVVVGSGKQGLYTILIGLGVTLVRMGLGTRRLILTAAAAAAVLVAVFAGIYGFTRDKLQSDYLLGKVVLRQAETLNCLQNALSERLSQPGARSSAVLFSGLVPRLLWPDKPSLSRGAEYGHRWCAYPDSLVSFSHVASITVLGDGAAEAGQAGFVVGLLVVGALLMAATLLGRINGFSATIVLALSPWLIDIDNHLLIYLPIIVKTGLCLLLITAVVWLWLRPLVVWNSKDIDEHE